jgi:hypothetical protein
MFVIRTDTQCWFRNAAVMYSIYDLVSSKQDFRGNRYDRSDVQMVISRSVVRSEVVNLVLTPLLKIQGCGFIVDFGAFS